jgi:hypothetical protein
MTPAPSPRDPCDLSEVLRREAESRRVTKPPTPLPLFVPRSRVLGSAHPISRLGVHAAVGPGPPFSCYLASACRCWPLRWNFPWGRRKREPIPYCATPGPARLAVRATPRSPGRTEGLHRNRRGTGKRGTGRNAREIGGAPESWVGTRSAGPCATDSQTDRTTEGISRQGTTGCGISDGDDCCYGEMCRRRRWRGHSSFWGAIDTRHVLRAGTPNDVRAEVRRRIRDLGPGGGYVVSPRAQHSTRCPAGERGGEAVLLGLCGCVSLARRLGAQLFGPHEVSGLKCGWIRT